MDWQAEGRAAAEADALDRGRTKSIARLVVNCWGWALLLLMFCLATITLGLYSFHPFYQQRPPREMTLLQEYLPLILGFAAWLLLVSAMIVGTIVHARRRGATRGDLRPINTVSLILCATSLVIALTVEAHAAPVIVTFLDACVLVFWLIYFAIAKGVGASVPRNAWLHPLFVVASIVLCWW